MIENALISQLREEATQTAEQKRLAKQLTQRWEAERLRDRYHIADWKYARQSPQPDFLPEIHAEAMRRNRTVPNIKWYNGQMLGGSFWNVTMSNEQLARVPDAMPGVEMRQNQRAREIVDLYERAYVRSGGAVPMTWFVAQDPDDIAILEQEDFLAPPPDGLPPLSEYIYQVQLSQRQLRERDAAMEAQIQRRYDIALRGLMRPQGFGAAPALGPQQPTTDPITGLPVARADLLIAPQQTEEELYDEIATTVKNEILNGQLSAEEEITWGEQAIHYTMGALGWVFDKVASGADVAGRGIGYLLPNYYDTAVDNYRQEVEATVAQLEREREALRPVMWEQYKFMASDVAFRDLEETDPEQFSIYLDMAGGDRVMAFGFFGADIDEQLEADEQLKALEEESEQDYRAYIQTLEESDYRPSAFIMEALAAYGTHVPMRLATAATLMLTDDDMLQAAVGFEWGKLWEQVEANEFSPANVVGLDGTAVGLLLDLGAGIAFDPTTWIFGPRAKAFASRANHIDQIAAMANSPLTRRTIRDLARLRGSSAHGAMEIAYVGSWLDEVGMLGRALDKLGVRSTKKIGGRRYLFDDARAPHTQEIPISTVEKMLDDVDVARLNEVEGQVLDDLADSMEKNGFNSAIELEYSLHEGTIRLADGGKRLRALQSRGIERVPVTVRVVTSRRSTKMPAVKGVAPVEVQRLADLANGVTKATTGNIPSMGNTFKALGNLKKGLQRGYVSAGRAFAKGKDVGEVRAVLTADSATYFIVNDAGEVVAAAMKTGIGGAEDAMRLDVWTETALQGQGYQSALFDAARKHGDELLEASARGIMSVDGAANARAQAIRWFEQQGIDYKSLSPSAPGRRLADVLDPKDKLPRHSKRVDDYQPNVKDNVYVRPDRILPERLVYGDIDFDGLQEVVTEALRRGATMPSATRLATAAGWSSRLRAQLRHSGGAPGRWMDRFFTPQFKTTWLDTHGPTATARINETVVRLWGDDVAQADLWLNRVMEVVEEEAALQAKYADDLGKLAAERQAMSSMDDMLGGGWDDAYRQVDPIDTIDAPLGGHLAKTDLETGQVTMDEAAIARDFEEGMPYLRDAGAGDSANKTQILDELGSSADEVQQLATSVEDYRAFIREHERFHQENLNKYGYDVEKAATQRGLDALRNRAQLRAARDQVERRVVSETARLDAAIHAVERESLRKVVTEMWEDFNRTKIATNKQWAKRVDPETGMVPWAELRKGRPKGADRGVPEGGRQIVPDDKIAEAQKANVVNPEKLARQLSESHNRQIGVELPLSPLDMIIASEYGGAAYTKLTHQAFVHGVRESVNAFNVWWIIDKVLSPATAVTVSIDELQRVMHYGGTRAAVTWAGDKAMLGSAHAMSLFTRGKWNPRHSMTKLPKRVQDRITRLQDYSTRYKQAERQGFEGAGLGWDDVFPDDAGYEYAARQWIGGFLQDSGFRAFLRGEDAFREWFQSSPDALRLRHASVIDGGATRVTTGYKEVFEGWNTLLEDVILVQAGPQKGAVRQAIADTANQIDSAGAGSRALEPPPWILNHLGTVRGVRQHVGMTRGLSDAYFDNMLMRPVNYRRGFIADLVRTHEKQRLTTLFESQGKRLVPDTELDRVLGMYNTSGASSAPMRKLLHERAFDQGYVTQGYLDDIIEARVQSEVDNILFTWDMGSRAGNQTKPIFPFARPWADMMGFWGREVLARPALRGAFGGGKTPWGNLANAAADRMVFNPKPLATVSRLASTDFRIDSLAPGVDLPFGAQETDFSPMLFMPVGGENPFASLLPGLGILPLWAIDMLIETKYDPVEQPLEYQQLMDSVGDFVPSVAYQRGGILGRLLGGGTTGAAIELMADAFGGLSGVPYFNITSELGDIGREINRTRELSALLADPTNLEEILTLTDRDQIIAAINGLALDADRGASVAHGAETLLRKSFPASWEFDESLDQIYNVWTTTGTQFGDILGLPEDWEPADPNDADAVRQQADDIRSAFFDLEQWQRDLLIVEQPEIAVNLVSSWDYTPSGIANLGVETGTAYRTDGTREARARHQLYVDQGYIRPIEPVTRALRILGLQQASKESAAKEVYTQTATYVNDQLWEGIVSEDTKALLDSIAQSEFGQARGFESGREVWQAWGNLEAELEDAVARENGITEDMEQWDAVKSRVNIPTREQAWGSSWPGLTGASKRFNKVTFNELPEEVQQIAAALGMELTPGTTGEALFEEVARVLTDVDSMAYQIAKPAYDEYIGSRTVGASAWEAVLRAQAHNPNQAEGWRNSLSTFLQRATRLEERSRELDGRLPMSEAQSIVDEYNKLRMIAPASLRVDWTGAWEGRYERTFGPLEWIPPEPPQVTLEDGSRNPNAWQPYIQRIVDGDTLIVSERAGPAFFNKTMEGTPTMQSVRLLGVMARELGGDGGIQDRDRLVDFLTEARDNNTPIWLVRDPETFGTNTDAYGRELAWLVVGDSPFYFPEELDRSASEGGN